MQRTLALLYGMVSYLVFFVTFLYMVGFVGNLVVPKSIDSGGERHFTSSLIIDVILLGLFAVQHSVMARPGFKRAWTRIVPQPIERSTYVLLASLLLAFLFWQWQPLLSVVWEVRNPVAVLSLNLLFVAGWAIVVMSTALMGHLEMFGIRQVSLQNEYTQPGFRTPFFYQFVRHPIMLGFIITFWATPRMTLGHVLFAAANTAYILVAIQLEERDLNNIYGQTYDDYRRRVSMLLPLPKSATKKHKTFG